MVRFLPRFSLYFPALFLFVGAGCATPAIWEGSIQRFEEQDRKTPPPPDPVLFVGSSTIRFWNTAEAFPGLSTINRGFGGSGVADVLHYFDRIVLRYHPRVIVFYSGDNDLSEFKSADEVAREIRELIDRIHRELPRTKLVIISIKPSPTRWNLIDKMRQVNRTVQTAIAQKAGDVFIDLEPKLLGPNGKPRPEMFRFDGLHLSEKGYQVLDEAVRPNMK